MASVDRHKLICELVRYERAIEGICEDLRSHGWDIDSLVVELLPDHVANVIGRFVRGELTAKQIDTWANAIECRDDVGYDPASICGEALHELANPETTESLSVERASMWMVLLDSAHGR